MYIYVWVAADTRGSICLYGVTLGFWKWLRKRIYIYAPQTPAAKSFIGIAAYTTPQGVPQTPPEFSRGAIYVYIYIYVYAADPRRKGLKRREGGREREREGPRKPQ